MQNHTVKLAYFESNEQAELGCPLCGDHWVFPYPVIEHSGKLRPSMDVILAVHFYGHYPGSKGPCPEFVPANPPEIEAIDAFTVVVKVPKKALQHAITRG
jgi:hypothetical protein